MADTNSVEYALLPNGGGTVGVVAPYSRVFPGLVAIPFHFITVAIAAPRLVIGFAPKGFKPVFVAFSCEALSASAGVGLNIQIGDVGDTDRLMADTDCDAAVTYLGPCPTVSGYDYEYTADTLIYGTVTAAKTPIVSKKISGLIAGVLSV